MGLLQNFKKWTKYYKFKKCFCNKIERNVSGNLKKNTSRL